MRSSLTVHSLFFGLVLALFALLVALLLKPFLSYLLAVLLLAFVLHPLQQRLAPYLGARLSALVLVVAAIVGLILPVALMVVTLPADASDLSHAIERVSSRIRIERQLERVLDMDVSLESTLANAPRQVADVIVGDVSTLVSGATHAFLGVVLLLFVLYYLLKDGSQLVAWLQQMTPLRPEIQEDLYTEASVTTWAVLKGHVLVTAIQGIVAGIGLFIVGVPYVVFWTVLMMFLELFPIIGVAAVLGPAVLYLGVTGRLLEAGFLLLYGLTAVTVVDDYLRALVVDQESSLHSAVILLGVFGGVYVFGVMGIFYGPIILGIFKTLIQLSNERYVPET